MAAEMPVTQCYYTLITPASMPRTLTILFEEVNPHNTVLDVQAHHITISRDSETASIMVEGKNRRRVTEEILLVKLGIVYTDFIPRVFGKVPVMYGVAADRVAVFTHPFSVGIDPRDRIVAYFQDGMFDGVVFRGRKRVEGVRLEHSSVGVFHAALKTVFGGGKTVR